MSQMMPSIPKAIVPTSQLILSSILFITILMPLATMAIKCWDCNSMINKGCDDPFKPDDFAMADCSQKHLARFPDKEGNICRKTTQKINDEYRIIRGCGYINDTFDTIPPGAEIAENDQCFRRTGTFSVMVEYCICNSEDGCNHSLSTVHLNQMVSYLLPLIVAIGLTFIRR